MDAYNGTGYASVGVGEEWIAREDHRTDGPWRSAIGCKRGSGRSNINTSHSSGDEPQEQEGVSLP